MKLIPARFDELIGKSVAIINRLGIDSTGRKAIYFEMCPYFEHGQERFFWHAWNKENDINDTLIFNSWHYGLAKYDAMEDKGSLVGQDDDESLKCSNAIILGLPVVDNVYKFFNDDPDFNPKDTYLVTYKIETNKDPIFIEWLFGVLGEFDDSDIVGNFVKISYK